MSSTPEGFEVHVHATPREVRVVLVGDLDLASVGEVDRAVERLELDAVERVVLELSGLAFCSSVGLRSLLRFADRARTHGCQVASRHPQPVVRRVVDVAGVAPLLGLQD